MYKVELLVDEIDADLQDADEDADVFLAVGTVIVVGDESGLGIVGRIISVRIRVERSA